MTNYLRAFSYLDQLQKRAYWSQSKLEEYQNKKLQQLVRYAYLHVPYYNRKFKALGLGPEDIKSKHDLVKLPLIRKAEIKANLSDFISDEYDVKKLRMVSTSGSTGEPLFLYLNSSEVEFRKAKHLRANTSLGQKPWDRWVTITGPQHVAKTTRFQRLLGLYMPVTVSVFNDISKQISLLEELKPAVLDGYSSSLYLLAKEVEKRNLKTIRPRFIIGGAELVDASSRKYVSKVFGVPFYDQYSSVEFERMAWQCPECKEYHIDADALVLEFLDKAGEGVAAGESGEVVCTSLFNYAMPLIRYAIGDVGIPSNCSCDCERTLPMMRMVEGRKDSLLILPSGQMLTPRAFTFAVHLFEYYDQIEKFRVIQKKLDLFEFNLKLKNSSRVSGTVIERALLNHLAKTFSLDGAKFFVNFVDDIPLDKNGKLSIVVSQLDSNSKAKLLEKI